MFVKMDKRERADLFRERVSGAMAITQTSRAALARGAGIDRSTISQLLSGDSPRLPGGHVVAGVAEVLGVSADWLLGLTDRPEQAGALLATTLSISEAGRAADIDQQIAEWLDEARGYKIRHVPATLPDMLKTNDLMEWEYQVTYNQNPDHAIAVAEARLDWMRQSSSDFEIAMPLHELGALAAGTGYYQGLAPEIRHAQLDWLVTMHRELYPVLRLFLFDARHVFSAPITVFGPKIAAIYLGRYHIAFRDRERVQALSHHFDWLIRESELTARQVPDYIAKLRIKVNQAR